MTRLCARHGVDWKLIQRDPAELKRAKESGAAALIEGDMWILENAVKRGITVTEMLRNIIDARIATAIKDEDLAERY